MIPTIAEGSEPAPPNEPALDSGTSRLDALFAEVYDEIRRLASGYLTAERLGRTLQPTELVLEAYLRFRRQRALGIDTPEALVRVTARVMRRVLVDHARGCGATKRRGGRVSLDDVSITIGDSPVDVVLADDLLRRLVDTSPTRAALLEIRVFGGKAVAEAAAVLGLSKRTAEREWSQLTAWVREQAAA